MAALRHVLATPEDARRVAPQMHEVDKATIDAIGAGVEETLCVAIAMSLGDAWVTYIDGELAALWGVTPMSLATGSVVPWLVTTKVIDHHHKTFYKESRRLLAMMRRRYSRLSNAIDSRHAASLRWARRLGFTIAPAAPHGPQGVPFHLISMEGV